MRLYRDQDGTARAQAHGEYQALAGFLESDVQDDRATCLHLLHMLETPACEICLNAYSLRLDSTGAHIEELTESPEPHITTYPRTVLFQALESWMLFINQD